MRSKIKSVMCIISAGALMLAMLCYAPAASADETYIVDTNDINDLFNTSGSVGWFCYNMSEPTYDDYASGNAEYYISNTVKSVYETYLGVNCFDINYWTSATGWPSGIKSSIISLKSKLPDFAFLSSKDYLFDFSVTTVAYGTRGDMTADDIHSVTFTFGDNNKQLSFSPSSFSSVVSGTTTYNTAHFRFTVSGEVIVNKNIFFSFFNIDSVSKCLIGFTDFCVREYTEAEQNADAIGNIGSDIDQPDFGTTNSAVDDMREQQEAIDEEYKINTDEVASELSAADDFLNFLHYRNAVEQIQRWIDQFVNDNVIFKMFIITCLALGVAVFAIGRGFKVR